MTFRGFLFSYSLPSQVTYVTHSLDMKEIKFGRRNSRKQNDGSRIVRVIYHTLSKTGEIIRIMSKHKHSRKFIFISGNALKLSSA